MRRRLLYDGLWRGKRTRLCPVALRRRSCGTAEAAWCPELQVVAQRETEEQER
jgi:hypothetical protein